MNALSIALIAFAAIMLAAVVLLVIYVVFLQRDARRQAAEAAEQALRADEVSDALAQANAGLAEMRAVLSDMQQKQATGQAVEQQHFASITRDVEQSAERMDQLRRETSEQLSKNREGIETRLDTVRETVNRQLTDIRSDNNRQLETIRATVDEKLSQTLNDRLSASFKQVSEQLEAVYKGLGDMQQVASGVGDLKRVLSNVKTRGILGEVQLGAILSDILTPDQYLENAVTKPGASERVEFAVKLPTPEGDPILLPIDSKFPGDAYEHLLDALDSGDAAAVDDARKVLDRQIKSEAKDIFEKYISVPDTTNFGIMFLPFEGLYAEVVNRPGLIETLARDFHVNVAGPSTMAAILNSLQMSYQTLHLQKRTDEVLRVLSAVKAELPKYQNALRLARKQIDTAGKTVDTIITTRTNVIEKKLGSIDAMDDPTEAARLLGTDSEAVEADSYETDGDE